MLGSKMPPKSCIPSSENMNMVSRMRKTRLDMWGMDWMKVLMILYSPFHLRISRRMRSTRSIRSIRKKESLTPVPEASAVMIISKIESDTIVPSRQFQLSDQYSAHPIPSSLIAISTMKIHEMIVAAFSRPSA